MKKYSFDDFKPVMDFLRQRMVAPDKLPTGIFGVADKDGILGIDAEGAWPDGKKVKVDDIYFLFSVTKPITGIAIAQLWERGLLHPDEKVEQYIPGFGVNGKENITIWHLLTHTSGIDERGLFRKPSEKPMKGQEFMDGVINAGTLFPCGTYKSYNTIAFSVLGEIINRVTGMDYARYMEENIFKPLGMKDTSFTKHKEEPDRVIPIYSDYMDDYSNYFDSALPGAGLFSTANDLLLLGRALLNDGEADGFRLLSPSTIKAMTKPQTIGIPYYNPRNNVRGVEMGLTWFLPLNRHSIITNNIYGHNGAGDCMFWIYPESGLAFVFMTNHDCSSSEGADIDYIHNVFSACI